MRSPQTRQNKKYIDRWWLKYEAAGALDEEVVPRELFFEFADSAYEAWLKSGKTAAQIEADIKHHIAVQKVFKKWREIHGDKI
ncbi:hypothetical protein HUU05_00325 [candidate division KSB1 bacterium]|nr:hypothetical protein [candidate division KSB1 bacterium]